MLVWLLRFVQASALAPRVQFAGLSAAKFRHPLDSSATTALTLLPGSRFVERAVRRIATPQLEQSARLDNLANGLRVSERQLPELWASLLEAAAILDIKAPELYVRSDPRPNAYTLALDGKTPFVVVTSGLLQLCDARETQAVLAHELGHLKCEHSLWLLLGNIAALGLIGLPIVGPATERLLGEWRRAAEFSCDRAALLVAQDVDAVAAALLKLVSGASSEQLSMSAYLEQAREYDLALESSSRLVRMQAQTSARERTHPLPIDRVAQLDKWARSAEYTNLIASGKPLAQL